MLCCRLFLYKEAELLVNLRLPRYHLYHQVGKNVKMLTVGLTTSII